MYDDRTNLGQLVARAVREVFKDKVFNTTIPRNVRLGEAPSHGLPAVLYDGKSRGAAAYGLARRGLGRRIGGGAAQALYIGLTAASESSPARAVCVIPRGHEEGQTAEAAPAEAAPAVEAAPAA